PLSRAKQPRGRHALDKLRRLPKSQREGVRAILRSTLGPVLRFARATDSGKSVDRIPSGRGELIRLRRAELRQVGREPSLCPPVPRNRLAIASLLQKAHPVFWELLPRRHRPKRTLRRPLPISQAPPQPSTRRHASVLHQVLRVEVQAPFVFAGTAQAEDP